MTPTREPGLPAYGSLAAFMAHYRALCAAHSRTADEDRSLSAMRKFIGALPPDGHAALETDDASPAARRHRERAEMRLRRELIARGALAG
jgi:hypothetical protein